MSERPENYSFYTRLFRDMAKFKKHWLQGRNMYIENQLSMNI